MLAHLWRDAVFPRRLNRPRAISNTAFKTTAIATLITIAGTSLIRADNTKTSAYQIDTEHLFGFVEGADIGNKGETEFVVDSSQRAGRSTGSFADTGSAFELKYTAFENFRISAVAAVGYYDIAGVTGIGDARRAAVQSLAFDARFRVLDRAQAPFGLTLSISPHWGLVDETSGVPTEHFGTEIQMLADRELIPGRLIGAV